MGGFILHSDRDRQAEIKYLMKLIKYLEDKLRAAKRRLDQLIAR